MTCASYFPCSISLTHFTKFVTEIMLLKANNALFLDKWLQKTEEECFTQQQKVFVSVFSIAGYLVFNSANPLRVRFGVTQITDILIDYFPC